MKSKEKDKRKIIYKGYKVQYYPWVVWGDFPKYVVKDSIVFYTLAESKMYIDMINYDTEQQKIECDQFDERIRQNNF